MYREIPDEFIGYLMYEKPLIEWLDFIIDLAHYEWMELTLKTEKSSANPVFPSGDDLLSTAPVFNPVLHLLHYDDYQSILPFGMELLQQLITQQIIIGVQYE